MGKQTFIREAEKSSNKLSFEQRPKEGEGGSYRGFGRKSILGRWKVGVHSRRPVCCGAGARRGLNGTSQVAGQITRATAHGEDLRGNS